MAAELKQPKLPNILITGSVGTGKTTLAEMLADATGMEHINVGAWVKDKELHDGYLEEHDSYDLNEDKLLDEMEGPMVEGFKVVDFHSCELFPERWFSLVVVLRADNGVLFDRLEKRGYNTRKIDENVESEIMQVVLDEAKDSFDERIVLEMPSNNVSELESNVNRLVAWIERHKPAQSIQSEPVARIHVAQQPAQPLPTQATQTMSFFSPSQFAQPTQFAQSPSTQFAQSSISTPSQPIFGQPQATQFAQFAQSFGQFTPFTQPESNLPFGQSNQVPFGQSNQVPFGQSHQLPFGQSHGQSGHFTFGQSEQSPFAQSAPSGQFTQFTQQPPRQSQPGQSTHAQPLTQPLTQPTQPIQPITQPITQPFAQSTSAQSAQFAQAAPTKSQQPKKQPGKPGGPKGKTKAGHKKGGK